MGVGYVGATELVENNNYELCLLGDYDPGPERRQTVRQERQCEFYILSSQVSKSFST